MKMGRNLAIILFAIALTQPGHTAEEIETNTPINTCDENEQYNKTSTDYLVAIQGAFKTTLDGEKINIKDTLNEKSDAFLKATAVCSGTLQQSWNATVFNDFVAYALNNVSQLQELNKTNQFGCILKHKIELNNCINKTMTEDYNITYSSLIDLSKLQFNDITCPRSNKYKACTLEILKKECSGTVSYVTSLFDYMQEYCKKKNLVRSGSSSTKMMAFWVGLVLCVVHFTKRTSF